MSTEGNAPEVRVANVTENRRRRFRLAGLILSQMFVWGSLAIFFYVIAPLFEQLASDFGPQLPFLTRVLIGTAQVNSMCRFAIPVLLALIIVAELFVATHCEPSTSRRLRPTWGIATVIFPFVALLGFVFIALYTWVSMLAMP